MFLVAGYVETYCKIYEEYIAKSILSYKTPDFYKKKETLIKSSRFKSSDKLRQFYHILIDLVTH